MYPPQQSRQRTVPSPQGSLVLPFITISTSHSHLVLNPCAPGKHSPFSTILLFLRMLYIWDLQCVTFGVWLFFTQGNSLQIHSGCSVSQWFSPFHRQVTVHGMDGAQPVYECTHCRSSRLLAVHCGCSECNYHAHLCAGFVWPYGFFFRYFVNVSNIGKVETISVNIHIPTTQILPFIF